MAVDQDTVTEYKIDTNSGDHDKLAHIVYPQSAIVESAVTGNPVEAVCGKVWVPSGDPKNYPVCQTCVEIAKSLGLKLPTI